MLTEIKKKKCKGCGDNFTPFRTTNQVCSKKCAFDLAEKKAEKKKESGKEKVKNERKHLLEVARVTFNKFIRERDKKEKCFCCGKELGIDYQAGHVFSGGGHASVMFDEDNVHAQRFDCNNSHRSTILNDMMQGCENRIGEDAFIVLREKAYEQKKWEIEELKFIIKKYKS